MTSQAFQTVMERTGYWGASRQPVPGLTLAGSECHPKLRAVLDGNNRIGLDADAIFSAQDSPISIFKDAGTVSPNDRMVHQWREAAWNLGLAPLLWVVTPTEVRIYDCYRSVPDPNDAPSSATARFDLHSARSMAALDANCGRLATETGAFWSSAIGERIDRRHRVDRELLDELRALEDRLVSLMPADRGQASGLGARDFAQRLIGRCIFMNYLLDRDLAQPFLPSCIAPDASEMFRTPDSAFKLFNWLQETFNGDLFPMDDEGGERGCLKEGHLESLRSFIEGFSLIPGQVGQGRLFRFRFNAIPVSLISSIYEQFAQSNAASQPRAQAIHYTPIEVVHLVLDPVFEGLSPDATILDPTCGSGAFLVESFRRLVWRKTGGAPAQRALVRKILQRQVFGIDISSAALRIAAFSLYLAALELDSEPVDNLRDLKFDRLIGKTLFRADALSENIPRALASKKFDAVVGNPPWTFNPSLSSSRVTGVDPLPRRSPDWRFLHRARHMTHTNGRIGLVMKATPFFSLDKKAVTARQYIIENLAPCALVNLSQLRREKLFSKVTGPALVLFARCKLIPGVEHSLVGSIPWSQDFRRTGIFPFDPGNIRPISVDKIRELPSYVKTVAFGTVRDERLMERLHHSSTTLSQFLNDLGIQSGINCGQGFKVGRKNGKNSPKEYFDFPVANVDNFTSFRLHSDQLEAFQHPRLYRPRKLSIFQGPLLLCPKDFGLRTSTRRRRYCVSVSHQSVLYPENFYGISFATASRPTIYLLSGILNSSLTTFQLMFLASSLGVERPQVHPLELLALRVPSLESIDSEARKGVVRAEREASQAPECEDRLRALDETVYDLYELESYERVIVSESVARARYLGSEHPSERQPAYATPSREELRAYAREVLRSINPYLRARGTRHLEATVYHGTGGRADASAGIPGAAAVRFAMVPGAPSSESIPREGDHAEIAQLANRLRNGSDAEGPPYLNESRILRIYGTQDVLFVKPAQARYWTRTAGLNDADTVLADHWQGQSHGMG